MAGVLAVLLVLGITVVGCRHSPRTRASAPKSFVKGSGGETMILLRQGLDFDKAFREAIFILSRHGFEPEMMQPEAGYIRTRWNTTWVSGDAYRERYRVRILITFNPSRTQLVINAPAESSANGDKWVVGYDTSAIETLRNDLTQSIGN